MEEGGDRLLGAGELLRLGDLEERRLAPGEERFGGELESFLFCRGKGEGLYRRWMGGEYRRGDADLRRGGGDGDLRSTKISCQQNISTLLKVIF